MVNWIGKAFKNFRQFWIEDVSFIVLLCILIFIVFIFPVLFVLTDSSDGLFISLLFMILLFIGIFSAIDRIFVITNAILFIVYLFLIIIRFDDSDRNYYFFEKIIGVVNIISFLIINIRLLFRNDSYNLFRVIGAINVYLLIALAGAFSFEIIHIIKGNSIQSSMHPLDKALDYSDYIYYSLVSLTTVGYGDLIPMNTATKMLSVFISAIGMLFPAIVIALLISLKRDK